MQSRECYFPSYELNEGNKHRYSTQMGTLAVLRDSKYIILFITRHHKPTRDDKAYIPLSPWLSLRSGGDVTIYCWGRHNALTRPDNCDVAREKPD